jgi:hypothetical protein
MLKMLLIEYLSSKKHSTLFDSGILLVLINVMWRNNHSPFSSPILSPNRFGSRALIFLNSLNEVIITICDISSIFASNLCLGML